MQCSVYSGAGAEMISAKNLSTKCWRKFL